MDEDVTTFRMTPTLSMSAAPSPMLVVLNGGIRRIDFSWDAARSVIPNRCLSVSRCVCPYSSFSWREGDLPPPRAPGMCGRNPAVATAVMGRFDRRQRRWECLEDSSPQTRNVQLDLQGFIDAQCSGRRRAVSYQPSAVGCRQTQVSPGGLACGARPHAARLVSLFCLSTALPISCGRRPSAALAC